MLDRSLDIGKEGSSIYSLQNDYSCILLSTIFSLASQNELGSETELRFGKSDVFNVKNEDTFNSNNARAGKAHI